MALSLRYKLYFLLTIFFILFIKCTSHHPEVELITEDLDRYWAAYEAIQNKRDTTGQRKILDSLYLIPASNGLESLIEARNYKPDEFLNNIRNYPEFWASIRPYTTKIHSHHEDISKRINQLRELYPELSDVPLYFSIGAFRSNGTIRDGQVLIGAEMAMAGPNVIISELPEWPKSFYTENPNPLDNLELLCTHEYVHTQQNEPEDNLLSYCIYEGVAEFVSTLATGIPSYTPALAFGSENKEIVLQKFEEDLFRPEFTYNWLWGQNRNDLKVRDLSYYIGYSISKNFYDKAEDKSIAISELIQLDFSDSVAITQLVNQAGFLTMPLEKLRSNYEDSRPTLIDCSIPSEARNIAPGNTTITISFSEPMDTMTRGFDFGPGGIDKVMRVNGVVGWTADKKSFKFTSDLELGREYESLVSARFRSERGLPLKPYLIRFSTKP